MIVISGYQALPVQSGTIPEDYVEYRGVVHIHTTYSEGAGTPEEVLDAAKRARLDFIVITDHNSMAYWDKDRKRNSTAPLLLMGIEISTKVGHLLGLGLQQSQGQFSRDAQSAINEIRTLQGSAVIAHPTRPKTSWRDLNVEGFTGMEILNMNNILSDISIVRRIFLFPQAWINEKGTLTSLIKFDTETIALWDSLNSRRIVAGFYGADAHGSVFTGVPSYETLFRIASLHLVTRRKAVDTLTENDMRTLLRKGSFYISIDGIAPSTYVDFRLVRNKTTFLGIGELCNSIHENDRLKFDAIAPEGSSIRLMRNGTLYMMFENPHFDIPLTMSGAYRVEIVIPKEHNPYRDDRIWVITNHIYISS